MASDRQLFNDTLKDLKKFRKDLNNFNVEKKLSQGYPRWIVISHKEFLEDSIKELKKQLQDLKGKQKPKKMPVKTKRNPYKS
jgi:cell division protein FtsX